MRSSRGQTLVVFALALVLVVLMVLVTIEVGVRTRERTEAQVAADTAAYSQAVATARALNEVALLNRMSISLMVSMAATQSYISWSGAVRGAINNPPPGCVATPPNGDWQAADYAAALQVQVDQGVASVAQEQTVEVVDRLVNQLLTGQRQAAGIARAVGDPRLEARSIPDRQNGNLSFIDRLLPPGTYGRGTDATPKDAIWATMGSRGDPWVTNRGGGGGGSGFGDPDGSMGDEGVTTFGNARHRAQTLQANGTVSWADDDNGVVNMTCRGVPGVGVPIHAAFVGSSALQYPDDQHFYDGSEETQVQGQPVYLVHTLGKCARCPGIWPFFSDLTPGEVSNRNDLYGQPLLVAVLDRDYLQGAPSPWNLGFDFAVLGRSRFDNATRSGQLSTDDALRYQVAVSTAIAYYHRPNPNQFREPANVFNPFWRATLVSGTLARNTPSSREDAAVNAAGFGGHAAVLGALERWGFRGY